MFNFYSASTKCRDSTEFVAYQTHGDIRDLCAALDPNEAGLASAVCRVRSAVGYCLYVVLRE